MANKRGNIQLCILIYVKMEMTFYFSSYFVVLNEKDILFWILQYYCMWPDRPQYMDLWVIEKNLCGPLRFVFEYPCSRLSSARDLKYCLSLVSKHTIKPSSCPSVMILHKVTVLAFIASLCLIFLMFWYTAIYFYCIKNRYCNVSLSALKGAHKWNLSL